MASITSGTFAGAAGRLEYILNEEGCEGGAEIKRAAVMCHPHPLYGGTMHTKVVFQAARELARLGMPVLRFHFRGVGRSEGTYDHGRGEQDDLRAAMAFLREHYPVPLVLGGFSFGATVTVKLLAAEALPEVEQVLLLGLPVDRGEIPSAWRWQGPKAMISGAADEFASVASLEAYFARLAEPKRRAWIPAADHFLAGKMEEFRRELGRAISDKQAISNKQ